MAPAENGGLPTDLDMHAPNVARMYDYWLGGKDNYAADRAAAEQVLSVAPEARYMARQNRAFVGRAVRHLVHEAGIRQIIDIGTGLPTQSNVHEVAHQAEPGVRVLYVDNDRVVVAHSVALLGTEAHVSVLQADLRQPDAIFDSPALRQEFDLDRPVAIVITALLHFITDQEDPQGLIARYRAAMAPGSHLVLSHSCLDSGPEAAAKIKEIYQKANAPAVLRTREQIQGLFSGFDLLEPGLVYTPQWRPDSPEPSTQDVRKAWMLAGVGRKTT